MYMDEIIVRWQILRCKNQNLWLTFLKKFQIVVICAVVLGDMVLENEKKY